MPVEFPAAVGVLVVSRVESAVRVEFPAAGPGEAPVELPAAAGVPVRRDAPGELQGADSAGQELSPGISAQPVAVLGWSAVHSEAAAVA